MLSFLFFFSLKLLNQLSFHEKREVFEISNSIPENKRKLFYHLFKPSKQNLSDIFINQEFEFCKRVSELFPNNYFIWNYKKQILEMTSLSVLFCFIYILIDDIYLNLI